MAQERLSMGRKRKHSASDEEVKQETVIVEVERKTSEKVVLGLKRFFHEKRAEILKALMYSGIALLVFLAGLTSYYIIKDNQGNRYYELASEFDRLEKEPGVKDETWSALQKKAQELCKGFITTPPADSACLLSAIISIKLNDKNNYLQDVKAYASAQGNSGYGAYYQFQLAQAYESKFELEKALEIYKKLQGTFKSVQKDDIGLYHQARIHYLKDDLEKAGELFNELLKSHAASSYKEDSQKYLLLIAARKLQLK